MYFELHQQQKIIRVGEKDSPDTYYETNIRRVGGIDAADVKAAYAGARKMKEFKYATGLARFPILQSDEYLAEAQITELALHQSFGGK